MTSESYRLFPVVALIAVCSVFGCAGDGEERRILTEYDAGADSDAEVADATGDDEGDPLDAGPTDSGNDVDEVSDAGGDDAGSGDGGDEAGSDDVGGDDAGNNGNDVCQPEGDGIVRRSEFPVAKGFLVPYEFALDVEVDIVGEEIDGTRVWDLEEISDDDFVEELEIREPDNYWFGAEFPEADYAVELSVREDELGVYRVTDDALMLLGLVTPHGPDSDEDHTHIDYDPPLEALRFPLEQGDAWTMEIEAEGEYAEYSTYSGHDESYEVQVDDAGEVITPYGTFDVLRVYTVREHPTSNPLDPCWYNWFLSCDVESRLVTFVAECFGTVARILSHENEDEHDFAEAAEVMRLSQ